MVLEFILFLENGKKKNFVDVFLFYKSFFEKFFKGINYILGMEEGVEIVYI